LLAFCFFATLFLMKQLVRLILLLLLIVGVFSLPQSAQAQHACQCTPTCARSCTLPSCGGACSNVCLLGAVTNLQYSGSGMTVNLSWTAATNTNTYKVNVTDADSGLSLSGYPKTGITATSDSFTGQLGKTYNWTVQPFNDCYSNGTIVNGPQIGTPNPVSVILAVGEAESCTNTACNSRDLIVGLDKNNNRQIPIRITIFDTNAPTGSRISDISGLRLIFDNTSAWGDGSQYRILYTDNQDGSYSVTEDAGDSKTSELAVNSASATYSSVTDTLTINFNLDVSGAASGADFLSNVYLNVWDFSGLTSGRVLKVGNGDFTASEASYPYGTNSTQALDIWNGRDVMIDSAGFYQVDDYNLVCDQAVPGWDSSPVSVDLAATYGLAGLWEPDLIGWASQVYYQPFYSYNSGNVEAQYSPVTGAGYFLLGMSSAQYGGGCTAVSGGSVTNNFKNGGIRAEDSGVGDQSLETAFAVMQVASSWSQVIDGHFFTNGSFDVGIEPITCPTCYLMETLNSTNNGLVLANGSLTAKDDGVYGDPQDWAAESQAGIDPFTHFELPAYGDLENMYSGASYTELTGDQTTGQGSLATITPNTSYFIDGNLTVNSSTLLRAAEGEYLLFVVNGNLAITSAVKDSLAGGASAIQAIFVVLGDVTIADDPADNNDDLTIEGALITQGQINFERSLYSNNNYRPPVTVVFRPDMFLSMEDNSAGIISIQKSLVSQY